MISKKLVEILQSFSHDEIKSFDKFLRSSFFNTNKSYLIFYKELVKFYPDFSRDNFTSEYIFSRIFQNKPFNKQVMWNLNSGLEKMAEEYLIHSAIAKNPKERLKLLIGEFEAKKLEKPYVKKLDELEKNIRKTRIDNNYFMELGELEDFKISYLQKQKGLQEIITEKTSEIGEIYTINYLINISRIIEILNVHKKNFNLTRLENNITEDFINVKNIESLLYLSKKNRYKYSKLIEFYCNVILCSINEDIEEHYFAIKDFLFSEHSLFEKNEMKNIAVNLSNYCIQRYQLGHTEFIKEHFLITRFRIKHDLILFENGLINKTLFLQIVLTSTVLNKLSWGERFIQKYSPFLYSEHRQSIKNLAKAYISFQLKKYDEVPALLKKFKFLDVADKIRVKNLVAKTYFETKSIEHLLYHIDSASHFLRKNKNVSSYLRDFNLKFYLFLKSIIIAIEKEDKNKLLKLKTEIVQEISFTGKFWLLEKIDEYIKQCPVTLKNNI